VGGRVVGTWTRPRGQVELSLFEDVDPGTRRALADDGADVARFLGIHPAKVDSLGLP
jgi:hypothetical protein